MSFHNQSIGGMELIWETDLSEKNHLQFLLDGISPSLIVLFLTYIITKCRCLSVAHGKADVHLNLSVKCDPIRAQLLGAGWWQKWGLLTSVGGTHTSGLLHCAATPMHHVLKELWIQLGKMDSPEPGNNQLDQEEGSYCPSWDVTSVYYLYVQSYTQHSKSPPWFINTD